MQGREERRVSLRACTQRRARVRRRGLGREVFEGVVVDIAPFGLGLRSRVLLEREEELELEVYPREGGAAPIGVRGVVRHVVVMGEECVAGVELVVTLGAAAAPVDPQAVAAALASLKRDFRGMDAGTASQLHFHPEEADGVGEVGGAESGSGRGRGAWLLCGVVLLLLVLAGGVLMVTRKDGVDGVERGRLAEDGFAREARADGGDDAPVRLPVAVAWHERAWEALVETSVEGEVEAVLAEGEVGSVVAEKDYVETLLVARLYARAGRMGEAGEALMRLDALESAGQAPEVWLGHGRLLREAVAAGKPELLEVPRAVFSLDAGMPGSAGAMVEESGASQEGAEAAPVAPLDGAGEVEGKLEAVRPAAPEVRLVVDASDHAMSVWQGGERVGVFPVGLGFAGATPLGRFEVINKIAQPDWYHRGEVVPYGDPRNPLGEYWMGLGGAPEVLGIGIHPTEAVESIGGNESRGCVRMFAADAEKVFGWCRVGTVVEVVE